MFLSISSFGRPVFWRFSRTDVFIFSCVSSLGFWIPDKITQGLFSAWASYWLFPGLQLFPPKAEYDFQGHWYYSLVYWSVMLFCCSSCSSNDGFLLGSVGKSELWPTSDVCWTGVADAVEGVFIEVASSMDPIEFLSVEVAVGVHFELFFFFFCLAYVMVKFYLLK